MHPEVVGVQSMVEQPEREELWVHGFHQIQVEETQEMQMFHPC